MQTKFQIDRHYLFLHGNRLVIFTERVLRNMHHNKNVPLSLTLWEELKSANARLLEAIADPALKRKARTEAIREKEAQVLLSLGQIVDYSEAIATCKSDVFTTGFRPHLEHRRLIEDGIDTRRRRRVSAKMAWLSEV